MTNKKHIFIVSLVALMGVGLLIPTHVTHAGVWETIIGGTFNLVSWVLMPLAYTVLTFMSLMTYLSGVLLNEVVYHTVVNMAQNFKDIGVIDSTWATVRDLANMGFIFVLLYAAIQLILGIGKGVQNLIKNIVIAALLINFSLFFTKLIIDASNILALMFYNAMAPGSGVANGLSVFDGGISNVFVKIMGIATLFRWSAVIQPANIVTMGVMGSITLAIVSFVFTAIALMFIIRYVVLILVLILSPIAFVSGVLPGLNSQTKQWWDALMGQAFFAPIFMLLAWIAASVTGGVAKVLNTTNLNWTDALTGTIDANGTAHSGAINIILVYIIVIVFLVAALVIAKSWAGKAGGGIKKLNDWATNTAGSWTVGNAGRFGRGTIGRAGQAIAESEWMKDKASNSMVGRLGMSVARKTGSTSFDLRGNLGAAGAGKPQKGGFAKDVEEKVKAEKKFADSLKPSDLEIDAAEKALKNAKDHGTDEDVTKAQIKLDNLKGVNEDEARKRAVRRIQEEAIERGEFVNENKAKKILAEREGLRERRIRELRQGDPNMDRKEAEDQLKAEYDERVAEIKSAGESDAEAHRQASDEYGWHAQTVKGQANERKTAYEKGNTQGGPVSYNMPLPVVGGRRIIGTNIQIPKTTNVGLSFTDRVVMFGNVKKERFAESLEIRKSMKEKSKEKKIMEAVEGAAGGGGDNAPETPDAGGGAPPGEPVVVVPPPTT